MLGDKSYLNVNNVEKSGLIGQIQESKFHDVLQEKDKEIKRLTKAIKKLKKELKEKEEGIKAPVAAEGNNAYFKNMIQREVSRYNGLKELVVSVTQRIKKISQEINSQFSICQSSASMQNLVKMLEAANVSVSKSGRSLLSDRSSEIQDEDIYAEQAVDEFQIVVRGLMMKHGQITKLYKQSLNTQKQLQQELANYKKELKAQRKSKDLLQKLLQKNQTEKNDLVNQINNVASQSQIQQLKSKTKQEIMLYYFKLQYRIKDLEKEKQEYIKSSTRDKQKQVKLYEALLNQVKNIKERQRSRHSMA